MSLTNHFKNNLVRTTALTVVLGLNIGVGASTGINAAFNGADNQPRFSTDQPHSSLHTEAIWENKDQYGTTIVTYSFGEKNDAMSVRIKNSEAEWQRVQRGIALEVSEGSRDFQIPQNNVQDAVMEIYEKIDEHADIIHVWIDDANIGFYTDKAGNEQMIEIGKGNFPTIDISVMTADLTEYVSEGYEEGKLGYGIFGGYATYPNSQNGSIIILDHSRDKLSPKNLIPGKNAYHTIIHEASHADGLKHPDDNEKNYPKSVALYDNQNASTLSSQPITLTQNSDDAYPATMQTLDILAHQERYGINYQHNKGNTIHEITHDMPMQTISDPSGINSLIVDSEESVFLNLAADILKPSKLNNAVWLTQDFDVGVISGAGKHKDLLGNDKDNILQVTNPDIHSTIQAKGGDDIIIGGTTVIAGAGDDIMIRNSNKMVTNYEIDPNEGHDIIKNATIENTNLLLNEDLTPTLEVKDGNSIVHLEDSKGHKSSVTLEGIEVESIYDIKIEYGDGDNAKTADHMGEYKKQAKIKAAGQSPIKNWASRIKIAEISPSKDWTNRVESQNNQPQSFTER